MKKYIAFLVMLISILLCSQKTMAIMIDFESPAMSGLDGIESGVIDVDGISVEIQAGEFDQLTNVFTLGAGLASLAVNSGGDFGTKFSGLGGLGVNSLNASGSVDEGISQSEGIRFIFDSDVQLNNILLPTYGLVSIRVIVNDLLVGDFDSSFDTLSLDIMSSVSSLVLAPILGEGLSSDPSFFVTSFDAVVIPVSSTLLLILLGLLLMASNRSHQYATIFIQTVVADPLKRMAVKVLG